jgi:hypothetical protein
MNLGGSIRFLVTSLNTASLNQAILWTQHVNTAVSNRSTLLRFVGYLSRMCATEYGRDKSYGMIGRP